MGVVRDLLEHPISVSSGYRSIAVNIAIGSKATRSQHTQGLAMDFTCLGFGSPKQIVRAIIDADINYDQLIYEFDT